jgi:hypothetical protein
LREVGQPWQPLWRPPQAELPQKEEKEPITSLNPRCRIA